MYFEECCYPNGFRCHWFPSYGQKYKSLGPKTVWLPTFFKISSFVFHRRKIHTWGWVIFRWTIPSKHSTQKTWFAWCCRSAQFNMTKRNSKLKWLLLIHLLLSDVVFGRAPLPQSNPRPSVTSMSQTEKVESQVVEDDLAVAHQLVLKLSASLQGQLDLQSNSSCAELSNGGWRGKGFSQELLGLAMVPVLASAGCLFWSPSAGNATICGVGAKWYTWIFTGHSGADQER